MPATAVRLGHDHATTGFEHGVSGDRSSGRSATSAAAVLATITRRLDGDLALAEDVVQDAFVAAAVEWDRRGVPDRPGAWLTTTAWRKALDRLRHEKVAAAHAPELVRRHELRRVRLRRIVAGGRPAQAALHLLPSRARARGADGADPAQRRRADRAGDRARLPLHRQRDGAAADAGAQQGLRRADPVPGAARRPAGRAARGRAARVYLVFNEGHAARAASCARRRSGWRGCSCG